jgi:transcription antitermination factor NusG
MSGHNVCDREGGAVSSTHQIAMWQTGSASTAATVPANWYAIQTRSRHEKFVSYQLQSRGIEHYLPIITEVHSWSDRKKKVELPLFSGYVFVHVAPINEERVRVLRADGVVRFVGPSAEGTPIPEEEIQSVRMLIDQKVPWVAHPFLKVGQRIRIRGGALDGVEGIFQSRSGEDMLVVSVDAIQRSLSISIRGYNIEVV